MERRLLLAIFLSLLVMVGYSYLMQQFYGGTPLTAPQEKSQQHLASTGQQKLSTPTPLSPPPQAAHRTVSLKTREMTLLVDEESASIFGVLLTSRFGLKGEEVQLIKVGDSIDNLGYMWFENPKINQISFNKVEENTHKILFSGEAGDFRVTKGFLLGKTDFDLILNIEVTNISNQTRPLYFGLIGPSSLLQEEGDTDFFDLLALSGGKVRRYGAGKIQNGSVEEREKEAGWLSIQSKYFGLIVKPNQPTGGYFIRSIHGRDKEFSLGFWSRPQEFEPGQSARYSFHFYVGPIALSELSKLGRWAEEAVHFGWFSAVGKFLMKGLIWLNGVTGSYGVAIILMTFLVTALFLPLTLKSYNSMSKMKLLQPEVLKLRELYKDKPQKLNKELMGLYRTHKVNPLGGCLPLVLQMPIFIAFYRVLMRSIELRGTSFLFIRDLSLPDQAIRLPVAIWPVGAAINLLPLLMVGAMFVQQRLTGSFTSASGPEAEAQVMMTKLMPALFGFMFYGLPSGLVLYWLTNTLLSIGTQRFLIKT